MPEKRGRRMRIRIKSEGGPVPAYETSGSAGMDIRAFIIGKIILEPGDRALIPTGLYIELPQGFEAQIRPRSGLAVKNGIGMVNGVGTIDSDYRGEIKIPMINWGKEPFIIESGDRIAQMIIARYERIVREQTSELEETVRGTGGFGHTGK
jgi:dUTP pyrophosphatase